MRKFLFSQLKNETMEEKYKYKNLFKRNGVSLGSEISAKLTMLVIKITNYRRHLQTITSFVIRKNLSK